MRTANTKVLHAIPRKANNLLLRRRWRAPAVPSPNATSADRPVSSASTRSQKPWATGSPGGVTYRRISPSKTSPVSKSPESEARTKEAIPIRECFVLASGMRTCRIAAGGKPRVRHSASSTGPAELALLMLSLALRWRSVLPLVAEQEEVRLSNAGWLNTAIW
jgi:hypothetical protein